MKIEKVLSERDKPSIVKVLRELLEELTDEDFIELETNEVGLAFFPSCRTLVLANGYIEIKLSDNRMIEYWGDAVCTFWAEEMKNWNRPTSRNRSGKTPRATKRSMRKKWAIPAGLKPSVETSALARSKTRHWSGLQTSASQRGNTTKPERWAKATEAANRPAATGRMA